MALRPMLLLLVLGLLPLLSLALGGGGQQGDLQAQPGKEGLQVEQDLVREVVKREADPRRRRIKGQKKDGKKQKKCKNCNKDVKKQRGQKGQVKQRNGNENQCDAECRRRKRERRKRKKNQIRQKKRQKKTARRMRTSKGGRQTTNFTSCVQKLLEYTKLNEQKATYVVRQVIRIWRSDEIQVSKGKKKGDFDKTKGLLLSALGGNKTAPKCDGEDFPDDTGGVTASTPAATARSQGTGFPWRSNARSAKDTMDVLEACSGNIQTECGKGVSLNAALNKTLIDCKKFADDFKAELLKCQTNMTVDAACSCVENTTLPTLVTEIEICVKTTKPKNDEALAAKKKCKKMGGNCKKAEAAAVEGIDTCKEKTSCGGKGVKDKASAEAALKALAPLSDALANPAFDNALKAAGLENGTGADGTVPGGRYKTNRLQARAADGAGCTAVGKLWGDFNTSATKTAKDKDDKLDESAAKDTTSILDNINGRSTLEEDLKSCGTSRYTDDNGRQISIQITIVKIRFYVFWCGWFRVSVIEIKITIITITFGVTRPPPAVATTAAPQVTDGSTSTKAAGKVARKQMLSNLMKRAVLGGPVAN